MKNKSTFLVWIPILVAIISGCCKSLLLAILTIVLIFVLVAILPFTSKYENLWLFILCAACSIPINISFLIEYPVWRDFIICSNNAVCNILSLLEMTMILTSIEEVVVALIGRRIWKRQYALLTRNEADALY